MSHLPEQTINTPAAIETFTEMPTPMQAENTHTAHLVEQFNTLEGPELEQAVATHLQSVVDKSLAAGADKDTVNTRLNTEWLKFSASGVRTSLGSENEASAAPALEPTFLSKLNYGSVQFGVVSNNQERIDQAEANITATAETVKRDMFSYQDVITDPAEKEQALNYTLSNEAADKYARAMAQELIASGAEKVDTARDGIRWDFDRIVESLPSTIKTELSPFAASDSWISWDIAKQNYLSKHPPTTDAEYEDRATYIGMGIEQDPLETEAGKFSSSAEYVQRSIAERHVGWEIQQMAQKGVDMSWLTSQNQTAAEILNGAVKVDGQLHSWQYVELGRATKDIAEYLSYYSNQPSIK